MAAYKSMAPRKITTPSVLHASIYGMPKGGSDPARRVSAPAAPVQTSMNAPRADLPQPGSRIGNSIASQGNPPPAKATRPMNSPTIAGMPTSMPRPLVATMASPAPGPNWGPPATHATPPLPTSVYDVPQQGYSGGSGFWRGQVAPPGHPQTTTRMDPNGDLWAFSNRIAEDNRRMLGGQTVGDFLRSGQASSGNPPAVGSAAAAAADPARFAMGGGGLVGGAGPAVQGGTGVSQQGMVPTEDAEGNALSEEEQAELAKRENEARTEGGLGPSYDTPNPNISRGDGSTMTSNEAAKEYGSDAAFVDWLTHGNEYFIANGYVFRRRGDGQPNQMMGELSDLEDMAWLRGEYEKSKTATAEREGEAKAAKDREEFYRWIQEMRDQPAQTMGDNELNDLLTTQQAQRAMEQAKAMRASMEMSSRAGMSPGFAGAVEGAQQLEGGIAGAGQDAQTRWAFALQNQQAKLAHYDNQIKALYAAAQFAADTSQAADALRAAREMEAIRQQHALELERMRQQAQEQSMWASLLGAGIGGLFGGVGSIAGGAIGGALLGGAGAAAPQLVSQGASNASVPARASAFAPLSSSPSGYGLY